MKPFDLEPARDLDLPLSERAGSVRREAGLLDTALHGGCSLLVSGWLKAAHRIEVAGREHLPERPPYVMVANHSSHLDAFALGAALPFSQRLEFAPIAAGDAFFATPALSFFAAFCLNALPLWRRSVGRHALADLREALERGRRVFALFPEGTRSRTGAMAEFKPGIGMLVAGSAVPVVPCAIFGAHAALPPGRTLPRPGKLRVAVGEARDYAGAANDRDGWRAVAGDLERSVRELLRE